MFNNSRAEKIIGANFTQKIQTNLDGVEDSIEIELLLNPKGKLEDFSVTGTQKVRDLFIALLELVVGKNFESLATPSLVYEVSDDQLVKTYWWQLLDEVHFHFSPVLSDITSQGNIKENFICRCFAVTEAEIKDAINQGAGDILTVTNMTKAAGGCGHCVRDIRSFIENSDSEFILKQESDESENEKSIYKAKYPRQRVNGKWPAAFLSHDLVPFLKNLNEESGADFELMALVEDHLYIRTKASDSLRARLESFLAGCQFEDGSGLKVFYS